MAGTGDVYVAAVIDRGAGHGFDWLITRYTSAGTRKWSHYVDGTGHGDDYVTAIAADHSGNVVVCGRLLEAGAAQYDFALACFSQAGTLLWTKRINGSASGMDGAQDLTLDAQGDIYVTGYVTNTTTGSDWLTDRVLADGHAHLATVLRRRPQARRHSLCPDARCTGPRVRHRPGQDRQLGRR